MAKSMTGYGRAEQTLGGRTITVEFKSVNHRYFEFSARVPRSYGYLEERLKSLCQQRVSRGKTDAYVQLSAAEAGDTRVTVNRPLVESYLRELRALSGDLALSDDLSLTSILRLPDIFVVEKQTVDEDALWKDVAAVAEQALGRLADMRTLEGGRLVDDMLGKLDTVEQLIGRVEQRAPQTVSDYRARLYQKLSELLADRAIDETRLLTESAIFAERIAIDEETVRLRSHLAQFRQITAEKGSIGRKLDFLAQEINREINTIGSKAQDADVAALVIELKSELEKIREQIQNLE